MKTILAMIAVILLAIVLLVLGPIAIVICMVVLLVKSNTRALDAIQTNKLRVYYSDRF